MRDLPLIGEAHLGDHLDHELMFTFFAAFSRFEYALKAAGLRREKNGAAEPDWDRFAKEIVEAFGERVAVDDFLKSAVEALVSNPPRKQRDNLSWAIVEHQGDAFGAANVLLIVRRVRNNLFHGGKAMRQGADGARDDQLVKNALVVLDRALVCHDLVRERFVEV
jgi:hypothetical protein